jgi:hypothetical protein
MEIEMRDETEILWKFYQEHCTWERHHEQQRASVTNLFLAVAAAVLGVVAFDRTLGASDLPLTIFLIVQGFFGSVFVAKHYQVFAMHQSRAYQYREALSSMFPETGILSRRCKADEGNVARFPRLHKLRLNRFWVGLHVLIALFGAVLTAIIVVRLFS